MECSECSEKPAGTCVSCGVFLCAKHRTSWGGTPVCSRCRDRSLTAAIIGSLVVLVFGLLFGGILLAMRLSGGGGNTADVIIVP